MVSVLKNWFAKHLNSPEQVMLLLVIAIIASVLFFLGGILTPVIVALVIAYLLDKPVGYCHSLGLNRTVSAVSVSLLFTALSVLLFVSLTPIVSRQSLLFIEEIPTVWQQMQGWLLELPLRYPDIIKFEQIDQLVAELNTQIVNFSQNLISFSLSSLVSLGALIVYLILVPLMVFLMMKDKVELLDGMKRLLPTENRLIYQVSKEMNIQIGNYIRGKVIEILIAGGVSCVTFMLMDLRYAILLGVLVGFSVLIPYIGAALVTLPIAFVAYFQWGLSSEFWWLMFAYGLIQALDGNVLVPILFSEAVSLHPLYIIIAVLFFGGLGGFWGVFFAIPLATLVKALFTALNSDLRDNQASSPN